LKGKGRRLAEGVTSTGSPTWKKRKKRKGGEVLLYYRELSVEVGLFLIVTKREKKRGWVKNLPLNSSNTA